MLTKLYQCKKCNNQYVSDSKIIMCCYCDSKEAIHQGQFSLEDINELLLERKELYIKE